MKTTAAMVFLACAFLAAAAPAVVPKWACPSSAKAADNGAVNLHAVGAHEAVNASGRVPAINAEDLNAAVTDSNVLVVFYSTNCAHCLDFVDKGGKDAPIEQLRQRLASAGGPKVVKFNIDEHSVPDHYTVQFVPSIYFVDKGGETMALYGGYDMSAASLNSWALESINPAPLNLAAAAPVVPKWACARDGLHAEAEQGATRFHAVGAHDDVEDRNRVRSVNAEDLNRAVRESKVLVVFYAPWCPHCAAFVEQGGRDAPIERLRQKLADAGGPKVVKFNVDKYKENAEKYKVKYLPTIYLVAKGGERMEAFTGVDMSPDRLKRWALNNLRGRA